MWLIYCHYIGLRKELCVCVCVHGCIFVLVFDVYACVCTYISMCISYVNVCACANVWCIWLCVPVHVYVCGVCASMCLCVMYMHGCIHVCMCVYLTQVCFHSLVHCPHAPTSSCKSERESMVTKHPELLPQKKRKKEKRNQSASWQIWVRQCLTAS